MTIAQAMLWTLTYLGVLVIATTLDLVFWRSRSGDLGPWMNLFTLTGLSVVFFVYMSNTTGIRPEFELSSFQELLLALITPGVLYILLDKILDPLLEKRFPGSEDAYQKGLASLKKSPLVGLIHIGLIAPIVEELLMRGLILNGLTDMHGVYLALLVSSVLFALLHFNKVQTVSGFVAGVVLGTLYLYTGSIVVSIIAHSLYNLLSYIRSTPSTSLKTSRKDAS